MTEQQLRDVLARVVPEPPESIADATPVVRVARRRRQVRVAGVAALAAVLVAGTVVGVRALSPEKEQRTTVVEQPKIPDPYTTAPCPDPDAPWAAGSVDDLGAVTAIRFCARDLDGFDTADGPRDALVGDVSAFTQSVIGLAAPDPARCAALDVVPTDSRLLFQLADGTEVGVPAGFCQDAEIGGGTLDGGDLTKLFLAVLQAQRGAHEYAQPDPEPARCVSGSDISPAQPEHDHLVAGTVCSALAPVVLTPEQVLVLEQAWHSAEREDGDYATCSPAGDNIPMLFVRTDRGDNLQLDVGCDDLTFSTWDGSLYRLDLSVHQLLK
jgi:hypothetical protein